VRGKRHRLLKVMYSSMRLKLPHEGMEFPFTPTLSLSGEREFRAGEPGGIYAPLAAKYLFPIFIHAGRGSFHAQLVG
jgi:hypothetical protein